MFIRFIGILCGIAAFAVLALGLSENAQAQEPIISEVRFGLLSHDVAFFGESKEEGADINAEILFRRLGKKSAEERRKLIPWLLSPRPHIGASINARGDTNLFYAGLTWDVDLGHSFFADASFGGVVHDGEKSSLRIDKKELGCRALFRGSASVGRDVTSHINVSVMLEHASNGGLCSHNEGLNNAGIRLGYKF